MRNFAPFSWALALVLTFTVPMAAAACLLNVYAYQAPELRGLILMAPHFFTEDSGLAEITKARDAYLTGDLKPRLAKYHRDVDGAFRGWADTWLDPGFKDWNVSEAIDYLESLLVNR